MSSSGNLILETEPRWVRVPAKGRSCPVTGLSKSGFGLLIYPRPENGFKPPVKSFRFRAPGQKRGMRLVVFQELLTYIEEHKQP